MLHRKTIADIIPDLPFSEIRKRARILVVDDDEQAFPYRLLQREGYNVQYWSRIESLKELESGEFDLIVLDIFGVASQEISINDGLGVLEHIKKYNPAQLVIAYSGQKYDFSQASFWRIADDYLGKPSSLVECKEKIDTLLKNSFTPERYWGEIVQVLSEAGVNQKQLRQFESQIVKSVQSGKQIAASNIEKQLAIAHHSAAIIAVLIQILYRFFTKTP